jgi:hypothetical protein
MIPAAGERRVCGYSAQIGCMQRAFTAGLLFAIYSHAIISYQLPKREHNGWYIKGFKVLCLLKDSGQAFVSFCRGSQAPLPLEVGALHA